MLLHPELKRVGVDKESWLGDHAAGLALTFDVDAESNLLSRGEHYLDHLTTVSHQQYGPRIGVPRILRLLEDYEVPATFFIPGIVVERWPEVVNSILEAGHEVGLHGYLHRAPAAHSLEIEIEEMERGVAALERHGVKAVGYRSPGWESTAHTFRLLREYEVLYDSSLMDDDRPYALETPWGRMAELPVHWMLDDWEQYAYMVDPPLGDHIEPTRKALEIWTAELDAMRETNSLFVLTCHPLLSGRPSRVRGIGRLVEFAQECGDVAFLRCDEIADRVLAAHPAPVALP
jgi:peptidoglycan/xylan/chitin deacetylase (PgdA/CDA1 family)